MDVEGQQGGLLPIDRMVVMGGEGNSNDPHGIFSQTEAYDPAADRWTTLSPMRTGRHGIGAAVVCGVIHVPGGATQAGFGAVADHEVFQLLGPSAWSPSVRAGPVAPWGGISLAAR